MWSAVKIQPQKCHVVLPNNFVVKNTHQKAQNLDSSLFILRLMYSCDYNLNFVKNKLKLIFITVGFMFQDSLNQIFSPPLFAMKFELTLSACFSSIKYPQVENVSIYWRKVKLPMIVAAFLGKSKFLWDRTQWGSITTTPIYLIN